MNYNKKSVEDIDVRGKRVLCRCDFNVPTKDGKITSDKRIVAALPTINYLREHGAKVMADVPVVVDDNFTTSQGMGTAIDFALEIVRRYKGDDEVERLKGAVVYWGRNA